MIFGHAYQFVDVRIEVKTECRTHGSAWACELERSMATQSSGHGTQFQIQLDLPAGF
jgi:hypothetical protein